MTHKGFDTVATISAPMAEALKKLGYDFAIRYLVPASYGKAITKKEAETLSAAGLKIGCCWETTASRARLGASAGMADGKTAKQLAEDIDVPTNAIIYFAVDYDAPAADFGAIEAYLRAAAAACTPYRVGVYGPYKVIEAIHERGEAAGYWQCVAWSGGKTSVHNSIYQQRGNVSTGVVLVDINYAADLDAAGMWSYPPPKWYDSTLNWAKSIGVMDGTRPEDPATRAEVAQMIRNFYNFVQPEDEKSLSGLLDD